MHATPSLKTIGISHLEKHVLHLVKAGRIPHTFLLHGERGCQNMELGLFLSRLLLCDDSNNPGCQVCHTCTEFMEKETHPDFFRIFPTGKLRQIKREQTNALAHFLSLKPFGNVKVIFIEEAERLSATTANALLKVLEEPPKHTYFILLTHQKDQLMPTILSRSYVLELMPLSFEVLEPWLKMYHADKGSPSFLYQLTGGYPKLLEPAFFNETIHIRAHVKHFLTDVKENGHVSVLEFCDLIFKEMDVLKKEEEKKIKAHLKAQSVESDSEHHTEEGTSLEEESDTITTSKQEDALLAESAAKAKRLPERILHYIMLYFRDVLLLNAGVPLNHCFFQDSPDLLDFGKVYFWDMDAKINFLAKEIPKIHSNVQLKMFFENCLIQTFL